MYGEAKTIAAVFVYEGGAGGVILCADTQITVPGLLNYPESKIQTTTANRDRVFFAYAGDTDFSKMIINRLGVVLKRGENKPNTRPYETLEREARKIHTEYYGLYPNHERYLDLQLLVVIRMAAGLGLYKIVGATCAPITAYECIGSGMVIARSVASNLYNRAMDRREAIHLASYVLGQAKKHSDGCGGRTQMIVIERPPECEPKGFRPVDPDLCEVLENDYQQIQERLRPVLIGTQYSGTPKDPKFNEDMRNLTKAIRSARRRRMVYGEAPPEPTEMSA